MLCCMYFSYILPKKNWPKTTKHMSSVPKERAPPFRVFNLNVTFCVYLIEFLLKNAVQFSKTRALCTEPDKCDKSELIKQEKKFTHLLCR